MNKNIEIIDRIINENYGKMEVKFRKNKKLKLVVGNDTELLKIVISKPDEYEDEYQKEVNERYITFNVDKKLNYFKMSNYRHRAKIVDEVKEDSELFYKICMSEDVTISYYEKLNSILKSSKLKKDAKEKMILIEFARICKAQNIQDWTKDIKYLDNSISRTVFRNILNEVALERGLKKSKDVGMKVDDIKDQIDSVLNEESDSENIDEVKSQNENLRSSLVLINNELEKYKQDLDKFKEEIELNVISDFIKDLNSDKYGRILDNFVKCQKSLKELKRNHYQFPVQVESIPILIRQYVKFIQEYGIQEIQRKQQLMLSYEDAAKGNYIGSPYEDKNEMKKVVVDSPGWIYKDMIISTPIYIEITN
ncbi:hypothetical protein [Intestinibacter sp.]